MPPAALLIAVLLALWSGPLLHALVRERPRAMRVLDGFVLVAIVALVAFEVIPGTLRHGGPAVLAFLIAGLFGPTLVERLFHSAGRQAHIGALLIAVLGLVLHTMADGAVVAGAQEGGQAQALAVAIVLHSIPVSMAVWWLLAPHFGPRWPVAVLVAMCAGTVAGYGLGLSLEAALGARNWAWLQALVAGSILHAVFGRPHLHTAPGHRQA